MRAACEGGVLARIGATDSQNGDVDFDLHSVAMVFHIPQINVSVVFAADLSHLHHLAEAGYF